MNEPHTDGQPLHVDLAAKLDLVERLWTPHRVATFDDHQLVLARVSGEFVWHDHKEHDEVFLPISGTLLMDFEGRDTVEVGPGQLLVVPAGTRHRPRTHAGEECQMLVIDPLDVKHTGDTESALTVDEYPSI